MPPSSNAAPSHVILTLGDVSFDWLWFELSPGEMKKRRDKQDQEKKPPFNWLHRQQVVTVALHGGAWYVDNFVRMLLGHKHRDLAYCYRRFQSHHLRAGEYKDFIHADTGYRLKKFVSCLPEKAIPVKEVKSVYRATLGPTYFGPLESSPPRPSVEASEWEEMRVKYAAEATKLKSLDGTPPTEFIPKALKIKHPYPASIPAILVLHDENNGFSLDPNNWSHVLPKDGVGSNVKLIMLNLDLVQNLAKEPPKNAEPRSGQAPKPSRLWCYLRDNKYLDRTVVIVSADDLRRGGVRISKNLSWERTAHDLLVQVHGNAVLQELAKARNVIVRFGLSGAIRYAKGDGGDHCRLYYLPENLEGEFRRSDYGTMFGYNAVLTATMATELLRVFSGCAPTDPQENYDAIVQRDLGEAVRWGLVNCRTYFRHGAGDRALDLYERLEEEWDHLAGPGKGPGPFPPELTDCAFFEFSGEQVDRNRVFAFELTLAERRPWKTHFFPHEERRGNVDDKRRTGGDPIYIESLVHELAQRMEKKLKEGHPFCEIQRGESSMAGKAAIHIVLPEKAPADGKTVWEQFVDEVNKDLDEGERRKAHDKAIETQKEQKKKLGSRRAKSMHDGFQQILAWATAHVWVTKVYDAERQMIDWHFGWPVCIRAFADDHKKVAYADVPKEPEWRIIETAAGTADAMNDLARDIVRFGAAKTFRNRAALAGGADQAFPVAEFGNLVSVDRKEIESFRSIRNLMREYLDRERPDRPLCMAVFGPPGSGKSFGVKEIAKSIDPDKYRPLEYNLSQFASREEFVNALVVARDTGIEGKVPLVFFDEFDSAFDGELGWLKYFLSVMQDGKYRFREGELRIGPAILVFAGGTSFTYSDFAREGVTDERLTNFQRAKGPDFVSRLRGHVDIIGPNPQNEKDHVHVIRRAITLHALLKRLHRHLVEDRDEVAIDEKVLRTLLRIPRYKHGVRSIEAILEMCTLAGADGFHKAALPAREQLAMHLESDRRALNDVLDELLDKDS